MDGVGTESDERRQHFIHVIASSTYGLLWTLTELIRTSIESKKRFRDNVEWANADLVASRSSGMHHILCLCCEVNVHTWYNTRPGKILKHAKIWCPLYNYLCSAQHPKLNIRTTSSLTETLNDIAITQSHTHMAYLKNLITRNTVQGSCSGRFWDYTCVRFIHITR